MKVLQINSVCGIGSTGRIATDIHNILIEQGHESYIAYGRDLPKNCDNAIRIGTKTDSYTHVIKTRILDRHGFGSRRATIRFIDQVKELDPDVIHLHNIHGYYINIEILFNYLKKSNKPVVWTLHDCWAFTGHCSYFDYIGCEKWQNICHKCPQKNEYPSSIMLDNSKNNYKNKREIFNELNNLIIITPSNWLAELVKRSYLKDYPVMVINNGIDLNVFKSAESTFRNKHGLENKFIILGVANIWDKRKGFKCFIDLSTRLQDDEIIVIVGISKEQKKQLPKNVIGITRTNNIKELAEIYSVADVFINPTLEDNFPTTNLESLACGVPVITFDTGGSVECIDERTGFVVEKRNLNELLNGIRKVKLDGKEKYTKECVDRAKRLYNKNDRYAEYTELYQEISTNR